MVPEPVPRQLLSTKPLYSIYVDYRYTRPEEKFQYTAKQTRKYLYDKEENGKLALRDHIPFVLQKIVRPNEQNGLAFRGFFSFTKIMFQYVLNGSYTI
jgi:hypothetical protein